MEEREDPIRCILERATQLAKLIGESGLVIEAILATHHHIDHLGVSGRLRDELVVDRAVMTPNPHILLREDKRRGDCLVEYCSGNYKAIADSLELLGRLGIEVFDISGHTEMVGFLLPDRTLIVGDLIAPRRMWEVSLLYMEDIAAHVRSLDRITRVGFDYLVLSHGTQYLLSGGEGRELIELNKIKVNAAIAAARATKDDIEAADLFLRPRDDRVPVEYVWWGIITAGDVAAYRLL